MFWATWLSSKRIAKSMKQKPNTCGIQAGTMSGSTLFGGLEETSGSFQGLCKLFGDGYPPTDCPQPYLKGHPWLTAKGVYGLCRLWARPSMAKVLKLYLTG